ncbi:hypothetical protein LPJ66_001728 [Kickxella alabastrina]|uniref:Uncharacterized protein n=1 Tax=Kickxella alabastrina TaxID=61397 RepID=A0ACC1ISD7_9FUNG|nr:hypothetical protein LPJ66_001728 [Kickxella alabastrina]
MRLALTIPFLAITAMAKCAVIDGGSQPPATVPPSSTAYWFDQPIDHFGLNNGTWQQQYMFNATFYKPGGPIYILTPGEAAIGTYYTDKTYFTNLAEQTDGLVVAVEHRFYGQSNPMPDLSGPSLKYHTIENTLEDFAAFIRIAKSDPDNVFPVAVSPNSKVVFGGVSYAASISAWMRATYPNIVDGAWASSPLIQYRYENYWLDQSWGKHLAALGCAIEMAQAVNELDEVMFSGNQTAIDDIQARFGSPQLASRDFAALISAIITINAKAGVSTDFEPTQYTVCDFFDSSRSNLDSYALAVSTLIDWLGLSQQALTQMADTTLGLDNYALGQVARVWYYQSCAWYGDWQVAAPASTGLPVYRSRLVDLEYYTPNCKNKFGNHMLDRVDSEGFHNKWFSILQNVSKIYYTAGSLDLWRASSATPREGTLLPNTTLSPTYLIDGATHAQDISAPSEYDLDSVQQARDIGNALVRQWIL